jgi:electron transport complex protein RnfE
MNKVRNAIAENPLLILLLGACPAMGATATVLGAAGMGAAALAVMVLSTIVLTALKKAIPACARIPACVIVVAGFVTLTEMLMNAFLPDIYQMMGIYLTVAAVDLLIFGCGEEALDGCSGCAVVNAVKTGLVYLVILVVMGAIREVLGAASFAGTDIAALANYKIPALTMAPGGFIVFSFMAAVVSKLCGFKGTGESMACAAAGICDMKEEVEQ